MSLVENLLMKHEKNNKYTTLFFDHIFNYTIISIFKYYFVI